MDAICPNCSGPLDVDQKCSNFTCIALNQARQRRKIASSSSGRPKFKVNNSPPPFKRPESLKVPPDQLSHLDEPE
jgi:hypothetical protein